VTCRTSLSLIFALVVSMTELKRPECGEALDVVEDRECHEGIYYVRFFLEQNGPHVIRFFGGLVEQLNKAGLGKDQSQSVGLRTKLNTKYQRSS
jgi:hypothetical protein